MAASTGECANGLGYVNGIRRPHYRSDSEHPVFPWGIGSCVSDEVVEAYEIEENK